MSDHDEKGDVVYSQENTNALFRELANDPSDHTSGRLVRRYARDGVLDASALQRLLADYRSVIQGASGPGGPVTKQDSVVLPNETASETRMRLERQKAEALDKWRERFPTLKPFVEVTDEKALSRLFPTSIETESLAAEDTAHASSMADAVLKASDGKFSENEQYTWDMCLVFRLGTNKPMKFQLVEPPTEEELRDNAQAPKKRTMIETTEEEHFRVHIATTIDAIERAGLHTFLFLSVQKDEVYCFVGADERRLAQEADRIEMDIRLDREAMIAHGKRVGLALAKRSDVAPDAWDHMYAKFRDFKARGDPREDLYVKHNEGPFHPSTPFHHVNRLKLIESIIKAEDILGGAGLQLRRQIRDPRNSLSAYFPLQHYPAQKKLKSKMLACGALWNPPKQEIVSYFGEQIALYFVFLSTYFRWLVPASIVGVGFGIYQLVWKNFDAPALPVFGLFMVAWATIFLEYLKRKIAEFRVEFGMSNFLEQETVRAEFEGDWVLSPISGKLEEIFPFWEFVKRQVVSWSSVILYIMLALGAVIGIFIMRAALAVSSLDVAAVLAIASAVNAVQIQIFNQIYARLSVRLNDFENHRTDSKYENSLIGKAFFFKVINTFAPFVYIAYVKRDQEPVRYCKGSFEMALVQLTDAEKALARNFTNVAPQGSLPIDKTNWSTKLQDAAVIYNEHGASYQGDCFGELAYQLFIIFGVMIFVNNAIEILGPIVGKFLQNRAQTKDPNAGKNAQALENSEAKQRDVETASSGPANEKLAKITDTSKQSDAENEFEYPQYEGTFADYDELVIQFGFVVLFVVVFPAAPFFALLNNIIEFRLDASKMLGFTRRPHPKGTYDMGTWFYILDLLSWTMVISNTGLLVFSSDHFRVQLTPETR